MTVAAVIIASTADEALAPVGGLPAVRRFADLAWSGGALPIVVIAPDEGGRVAAALAGAAVILAEPARGAPSGEGARGGALTARAIARGFAVASAEIGGTDGVLVWPARHVWVGPETVTSLIEAHGLAGDSLVIPTWEGRPGWPVLVPAAALAELHALPPETDAGEAIARLAASGFGTWPLNVGDPGAVLDSATPRDQLPEYEGPPGPVGGLPHEWGADVADEPGDTPLSGPALAPWPQAGDAEEG